MKSSHIKLLVLAVLLVCSTLTYFYYSYNKMQEDVYRNHHQKNLNNLVEIQIKSQLDYRLKALKRMADRWENNEYKDQEAWAKDVRNYIQDDPGYQAIEWVDSDYRVRWIEPLKGNEALLATQLVLQTMVRWV